MEDLKHEILKQGREREICLDGYNHIAHAATLGDILDYYLTIPDWCLERAFPDIHTIRANFSDCQDHGIYVDHHFDGELLNERQIYVLHHCTGTIRVGLNVDLAIIPMLYIANGCKLKVIGVGENPPRERRHGSVRYIPTRVPVYTFGDNYCKTVNNRYVHFVHYHSNLI